MRRNAAAGNTKKVMKRDARVQTVTGWGIKRHRSTPEAQKRRMGTGIRRGRRLRARRLLPTWANHRSAAAQKPSTT